MWGRRVEVFLDVIAVLTVVSVFAGGVTLLTPGSALVLAAVGLLVLRRRMPVAAGIAAVVASAAVLITPGVTLAVWVLAEICLFSVPLRASRPVSIVIGALHAAVLYAGALIGLGLAPLNPVALLLPVWTAAVIALGTVVRVEGQFRVVARQQIQDAARIREGEVLQRVSRERLGIARDLHDAVANSIAVISIQSAAAERALRERPEEALASLRIVRQTSRAVLTEVEEILAVLRDDTAVDRLEVASAANIAPLIATLGDAGMSIVSDLGPLPVLDPLVDTAAFRIVQEGLTNAQKHGDGTAAVAVAAVGAEIALSIRNPVGGRSAARADSAGGYGLVGMRERAELAGGSLDTRVDDGEFVVEVRMPVSGPGGRGGDRPGEAAS